MTFLKKHFAFILCAMVAVFSIGCGEDGETVYVDVPGETVYVDVPGETVYVYPEPDGPAKYVFLFIGDGMGEMQVNAAEIYTYVNGTSTGTPTPGQPGNINLNTLSFTKFPTRGSQNTHDWQSFITDSASAGTAIASGRKTNSGSININGTLNPGNEPEHRFKIITEYAKEAGMKIGIVTTVTLTHATPASFFGWHANRNNTASFATQLVDSGFDYFAGGNIGATTTTELARAVDDKGYTVVRNKAAFNALTPVANQKVIAIPENDQLQDSGALFYDMDRNLNNPEHWSIAEITKKGIDLLENPNGFFMMIEGGKIDWAGHSNCAVSNIRDVIAMDEAIKHAIEFAERYPDETLIIVTGDHETGGMTIGSNTMQYNTDFSLLKHQKWSFQELQRTIIPALRNTLSEGDTILDISDFLSEAFGINITGGTGNRGTIPSTVATSGLYTFSVAERDEINTAFNSSFGARVGVGNGNSNSAFGNTLIRIINNRAGIGWTTGAHTGVPLPVYVKGTRQALFSGNYDNTDIFFKMAEAMGLEVD